MIIIFNFNYIYSKSIQEVEKDSLYIYPKLFSKYIEDEEYYKAIYYGTKFMDEWDSRGLSKLSSYCSVVETLSDLYYAVGDIQHSISLLSEVYPIEKELFGEYSPEYASFLNKYSTYNFIYGKFPDALSSSSEALEIYKRLTMPHVFKHYKY